MIGSGPAAAACVTALVNRGQKVTVLDVGLQLEPERSRHIRAYRENGDLGAIQALNTGMEANSKGIPLKLSFGSDFPYAQACERLQIKENSSGARPSFAFGGLSNVWGAAMLPFRDQDIPDWPICASDLAPHYKAVAKLTGLTASTSGSMDGIFPVFHENPGKLEMNSQGIALWNDLEIASSKLQNAGLVFGRGRLAVRTASQSGNGCDYKGLCMSGCPDGYIYNSRDTIRKLSLQGNVDYRPGVVVRKISEGNEGVEIDCEDLVSAKPQRIRGEKVFLATGVIPTARILLESLNLHGRKLVMRDSQYFLFPLIRARKSLGVSSELSNTLSQIFIELVEGSGLQRSSHLQIYGYNELIGQALRSSLGMTGKLFPRLVRILEERLIIAQGYLHSDLSSTIETWLEKPDPAGDSRAAMHMQTKMNPSTRGHISEVVGKIIQQSLSLKAIPLTPMLQIAPPGRGFHTGGTFPMRHHPGELETDLLGRPFGWRNVHVVDSSILPTIPATTITFSVMANAHRIGSNCLI